MKVLAILVLVIALAVAQTAEQRKTAELVSNMVSILGQDKVERYLKCMLAQTCSNCTSNLECAWVSASTTATISVTDDDTKEVALTAANVNFCWFGSLTGMVNQDRWSTISNIEGNLKNGTNSTQPPRYTLKTAYGFSDYNWQQCQIRGGAALVLAIGLPIAACALCVCLIATVVCCVVCNKWLAPKAREKRKYKKQGAKL